MSPIYHYVFGRFLVFIGGFFGKIENRPFFCTQSYPSNNPNFITYLLFSLLKEFITQEERKYARPITTLTPHGGGELSID